MKNKDKIEALRKILRKKPDNKKSLELLGIFLAGEDQYQEAIPYLEKAIEIGSQMELVFLGLYIAYVEIGKYNKAIEVLKKYLEKKPAVLFKDTLEELLTELRNGYVTDYKETIIKLAERNNIPIPDSLK